jgi:hypothetical protein
VSVALGSWGMVMTGTSCTRCRVLHERAAACCL